MLKLLSVAAVASAMLTATLVSPVSAAQININTGHVNSVGRTGDFGRGQGNFAKGETNFVSSTTPNTPKQRKWVCGPIVNYDGTPHCHWGM
jgi:hypothetical protein